MAESEKTCRCGAECIATATGWCCTSCDARIVPYRKGEGRPTDRQRYDDEAESACPVCDGKGEATCPECDGDKVIECPHCGQEMDCEECGGTGRVECDECILQEAD